MKKNILLLIILIPKFLFSQPIIQKIDLNQSSDYDEVLCLTMVKSLKNNDIVLSYYQNNPTTQMDLVNYLILDDRLNRKTFFDVSLFDMNGQFLVDNEYLIFKKHNMLLYVNQYTGRLDYIKQAEKLFYPTQDDVDKRPLTEKISFKNNQLCINEFYSDMSFEYYYKEIKLTQDKIAIDAISGINEKEALILTVNNHDSLSVCNYNYKKNKIIGEVLVSDIIYNSGNQYVISISPDKNWIVLYSYDNKTGECVFEIYSGQEDKKYILKTIMSKDTYISDLDWSFDSSYFLLFETEDNKIIYKIEL